jgi:F-type H+-transporting ATPase subunit gamma
MAKTRDIRKRIISVRNIHKITRTMERVAQSKGMKIANKYEAAKAFRAGARGFLPQALGAAPESVPAAQELARQPLGFRRAQVKRVLLVCVTSSRGLCGGYNTRVINAARARMRELAAEGTEPLLAVMGKKGLAFFRFHNQAVLHGMPDVDEHLTYHRVDEIAQKIIDGYLAGDYDTVEVVSFHYTSKAHHDVRIEELVPFVVSREASAAVSPDKATSLATAGAAGAAAATVTAAAAPDAAGPLYLVEPDPEQLLRSLVPLLVKTELFCLVLDGMRCEQAQRMVAMSSASDNADSMTKQLTRKYNKVRQAQITNEMIEIISGSEGGRT